VAFVAASIMKRVVEDPSGDSLDALLCAVQAAWGASQPNYGLPHRVPRCEGWIVGAAA
jgi:hypothetical protein